MKGVLGFLVENQFKLSILHTSLIKKRIHTMVLRNLKRRSPLWVASFVHMTTLFWLSTLLEQASAQTTCLDTNFFPKLLADSTGTTDFKSYAMVASDGATMDALFSGGTSGTQAFIWRVDHDTGAVRWRRLINTETANTIDIVTALTLSPDQSQLVAIGSTYNSGTFSNSISLVFLRTNDGGYLGEGSSLTLDPSVTFEVRDQGLVWAPNGKIFLALHYVGSGGRMAVACFDPATSQWEWVREMGDLYGYAAAIQYKNICPTCANLLVTGAVDTANVIGQPLVASQWRLAIARLTENGESPADGLFVIDATGGTEPTEANAPYINYVGLDEAGAQPVLFGSIQSRDPLDEEYVWFFKVWLDSGTYQPTTGPTGALVAISRLEKTFSAEIGCAIGIKPDLVDGQIHFVWRSSQNNLHYSSMDPDSTELVFGQWIGQNTFAPSKLVFAGTRSEVGSIQIYESYVGSSMSVLANKAGLFTNLANQGAVILSMLPSQTCLNQLNFSTLNFRTKLTASLTTLTQAWQPDFQNSQTSAESVTVVDFQVSNLIKDDFCSPDTTEVVSVAPGATVDQFLGCQEFDEIYHTIAFTGSSATSSDGSECTDLAPYWSYSIDQAGINKEQIKVSIDSEAGLIYTYGRLGTTTQVHEVTVVGRLPNSDLTTEFSFTLAYTLCKSTPLTIPSQADLQYYVTDPLATLTGPAFTIDANCPTDITYTNTITPAAVSGFITNGSGLGRDFSWESQDDADVGLYSIGVQGANACVTAEYSFQLDVQSACNVHPPLIDEASIPVPVGVQCIYDVAQPILIDSAQFVSLDGFPGVDCGAVQWSLDVGRQDIEIAVTSDGDFLSIATSADQPNKVGSKRFSVQAEFADYPGTIAKAWVTVDVTDCCETDLTIVDPDITPRIVDYYVGQGTELIPFQAFTPSPSYCIIDFEVDTQPTPVQLSSEFTVDSLVRDFSVLVADLAEVGNSYNNAIYATYNGVRIDQVLNYFVLIEDICDITTFSAISPAVPILASYIVTDTTLSYSSPVLVPDTPTGCLLAYSFTTSDPLVEPAIGLDNSVPSTPVFEIYSEDLSLLGDYVITVLVETYLQVPIDSFDFSLEVLTPCDKDAYTSLQSVTVPASRYLVTSFSAASPLTITHEAFPIVSQPLADHGLCGTVTYEASFDGAPITQVSSPVAYDPSTRTLSIYTADESYVGIHTITLDAHLTDYSVITAFTEFEIEFTKVQARLTSTPQTNPETYFYDSNKTIRFDLNQEIREPPDRLIVFYSCQMLTERRGVPDLCFLQTETVQTTFDRTTGDYTITTNDPVSVPEGTYAFLITAVVWGEPDIIAEMTFEITFENPCSYTQLQLTEEQPFFGAYDAYYLRVDTQLEYDTLSLASNGLTTDCGPQAIEFLFTESGDSLDYDLFEDGLGPRTELNEYGEDLRNFTIYRPRQRALFNQTLSITLSIYLTDYPENIVTSRFTVTYLIVDECTPELGFLYGFEIPLRCFEEKGKRPAVIPPWLQAVPDSVTLYRNENPGFDYAMGEPINVYREPVNVIVNFGELSRVASYNSIENSIHIEGGNLTGVKIGYHKVSVSISYPELDGSTVTFQKTIYVQLKEKVDTFDWEVDIPTTLPEDTPTEEVAESETSASEGEQTGVTETPTNLQEYTYTKSQLPRVRESIRVTTVEDYQAAQSEQAETGVQAPPMPYVTRMSPTGELQISWSQTLVPYESSQDLPKIKVALEEDLYLQTREPLDAKLGPQRRLQQAAEQPEDLVKLLITDALEIKVESPPDSDVETIAPQMTWSVLEYSKFELKLQLEFLEPDKISSSLAIEPHSVKITFWGTEYFKNEMGVEVPLGTQLSWHLSRQIESEEAEQTASLCSLATFIVAAMLVFGLTVGLCLGKLLPFWMFVNTVQLVSHLALIKTYIPPVTSLFLLEMVPMSTLKSEGVSQTILGSDYVRKSDLEDYLSVQRDAFYTEQIQAANYHVDLVRNLATVLVMAAIVIAIWAAVLTYDSTIRPRKGQRQEPKCTNFTVRFFYEVFLQLALCVVIFFAVRQPNADFDISTGLSFAIVVISTLMVALLCVFCFKGKAPLVRGSYEPILGSFWKHRALKTSYIDDAAASKSDSNSFKHEFGQTIEGAPCLNNVPLTIEESDEGALKNSIPLKIDLELNNQDLQRPREDLNELEREIAEIQESIMRTENQFERSFQRSAESDRHQLSYQRQQQAKNSCHASKLGSGSRFHERASVHSSLKSLPEVINEDFFNSPDLLKSNIKGQLKVDVFGDLQEYRDKKLNDFCATEEQLLEMAKKSPGLINLEQVKQLNNTQPNGQPDGIQKQIDELQQHDQVPDSELKEGGEIEEEIPATERALMPKAQTPEASQHQSQKSHKSLKSLSPIEASEPPQKESLVVYSKYYVEADRRVELRKEAKARVSLQARAEPSERLSTLFSGLKRNHPHNMTLVHPITFFLRRVLFVLAIVLWSNKRPLAGVFMLQGLSLTFLSILLCEFQWESRAITWQHLINETVLYVCLVFMALFSTVDLSGVASRGLAWFTVYMVMALILFNAVVLVYVSLKQLRLHWLRMRSKGKKLRRRGSSQVLPSPQREHQADQLGEDFDPKIPLKVPINNENENERDLCTPQEVQQIDLQETERRLKESIQRNASRQRSNPHALVALPCDNARTTQMLQSGITNDAHDSVVMLESMINKNDSMNGGKQEGLELVFDHNEGPPEVPDLPELLNPVTTEEPTSPAKNEDKKKEGDGSDIFDNSDLIDPADIDEDKLPAIMPVNKVAQAMLNKDGTSSQRFFEIDIKDSQIDASCKIPTPSAHMMTQKSQYDVEFNVGIDESQKHMESTDQRFKSQRSELRSDLKSNVSDTDDSLMQDTQAKTFFGPGMGGKRKNLAGLSQADSADGGGNMISQSSWEDQTGKGSAFNLDQMQLAAIEEGQEIDNARRVTEARRSAFGSAVGGSRKGSAEKPKEKPPVVLSEAKKVQKGKKFMTMGSMRPSLARAGTMQLAAPDGDSKALKKDNLLADVDEDPKKKKAAGKKNQGAKTSNKGKASGKRPAKKP